jgi:hypothetical protein
MQFIFRARALKQYVIDIEAVFRTRECEAKS